MVEFSLLQNQIGLLLELIVQRPVQSFDGHLPVRGLVVANLHSSLTPAEQLLKKEIAAFKIHWLG